MVSTDVCWFSPPKVVADAVERFRAKHGVRTMDAIVIIGDLADCFGVTDPGDIAEALDELAF
jgi:hypothetical protein